MGKTKELECESLVARCIDVASASEHNVEIWRRQRRTLDRLPSQIADALLLRLLNRRLIYPSLLEVFQQSVEEVDLKGESCVDAEWMAYLGAFRHLRSLNLADCRSITNSAIWPLSGMTSLKDLDLSRCSKITDAGIRHLLSISNLEKLYISKTGLSANGVMLLSSLRYLRVLDMGGIPVTDMALCSLEVLTELEHLDIWGSEVSNAGVHVLKMFPRLSFLNLAWTNVTRLPNLPSISCLNLSNCNVNSIFCDDCGVKAPLMKLLLHGASFVDSDEVLSNVELRYITFLDMSATSTSNFHFIDNMKVLEHLDLSCTKMNDGLIRSVADVGAKLRYLNLSNSKITSQGICILVGNVTSLETLLLSNTAIDDVALSYIGLMPSLKVIDLRCTRIKGFCYSSGNSDTTFSLNALRSLSHLESLNLEETKLRDDALCPLASFKELKCLYLKGDYLSCTSLHALSSLSKLKFLRFHGGVVSDSGLLLFRPPPALRLLDLQGCWFLSYDTIKTFCTNHPGIEVKHDHNQTLSSDQNVGVGSSIHKINQARQLRKKGVKLIHPSYRSLKVAFVDERLKYSREELLELQCSPLSSLLPCNIPEMLRKE